MSKHLNPDDRRKLVSCLGMLGSDHDGECLAAARAAHRLVSQLRLTWSDIVTPAAAPAPSVHKAEWQSQLTMLDSRWGLLTEWERNFASSIRNWIGEPTEKQRAQIQKIVDRLSERVAS
jgi:hypothetical protein